MRALVLIGASCALELGPLACTSRRAEPIELGAAAASAAAPPRGGAVRDAGPWPDASEAAPSPSVAALGVPRAAAAIVPSGHFRVALWGHAANTHTLLAADGRGAVPVNEARFLWGDGRLYVFFYAGDLDLQAHATKHDGPVWKDDSVALMIGDRDDAKRIIQISVTGVVADGLCPADATGLDDPRCDLRWESGAAAAVDSDGTLNTIGDRDEEWAVEASIPFASLGRGSLGLGSKIPLSLRRCEMAHDGPRACGAWGEGPAWPGVLTLEER